MIYADVLIVGAGPAGSTAAWKLVQGGKRVIILDKYSFPRSKLCAGWITPKTVKDLELDFSVYTGSVQEYKRLHFYLKGLHVPLPTKQYSIRRFELDNFLLQRSGAEFIQHKVEKVEVVEERFIVDGKFSAKYLIGAGGTNCPVYHQLFKEINPRTIDDEITTMEEEFMYDWKDPECRLWFMENGLSGYSWYVPKGNGYLNVGIGGTLIGMKKSGRTIKYYWEKFVSKLEKLGLVVDYKFSPKGHNYFLGRKVKRVQNGNAFIVGDAVGLATLDMGEGIGPSVQSALFVAKSILSGSEFSVSSISKYSIPHIILRR